MTAAPSAPKKREGDNMGKQKQAKIIACGNYLLVEEYRVAVLARRASGERREDIIRPMGR